MSLQITAYYIVVLNLLCCCFMYKETIANLTKLQFTSFSLFVYNCGEKNYQLFKIEWKCHEDVVCRQSQI
jgi:hypothetical protein